MILNHVYIDSGAKFYELLKIYSFNYDENVFNSRIVHDNSTNYSRIIKKITNKKECFV